MGHPLKMADRALLQDHWQEEESQLQHPRDWAVLGWTRASSASEGSAEEGGGEQQRLTAKARGKQPRSSSPSAGKWAARVWRSGCRSWLLPHGLLHRLRPLSIAAAQPACYKVRAILRLRGTSAADVVDLTGDLHTFQRQRQYQPQQQQQLLPQQHAPMHTPKRPEQQQCLQPRCLPTTVLPRTQQQAAAAASPAAKPTAGARAQAQMAQGAGGFIAGPPAGGRLRAARAAALAPRAMHMASPPAKPPRSAATPACGAEGVLGSSTAAGCAGGAAVAAAGTATRPPARSAATPAARTVAQVEQLTAAQREQAACGGAAPGVQAPRPPPRKATVAAETEVVDLTLDSE